MWISCEYSLATWDCLRRQKSDFPSCSLAMCLHASWITQNAVSVCTFFHLPIPPVGEGGKWAAHPVPLLTESTVCSLPATGAEDPKNPATPCRDVSKGKTGGHGDSQLPVHACLMLCKHQLGKEDYLEQWQLFYHPPSSLSCIPSH